MKIPRSACALVCFAAGCSPVNVTGAFGDRALRVGGTAAAWVDATEYVVDASGGTPVLTERGTDAVVLHLLFTEAVFDPRLDLRALPAGDRDAIRSDIERGDRLFIDVRRGDVIRPGDPIALVPADGSLPPEVLPFLDKVAIVFGEPVLDESSAYPDRAPRVGSQLAATFEVSETSPELVGEISLEAKKAEGEGDGFLEGEVTVGFGVELLPERLAECNFAEFDQGIAGACNLN
jgi:hypothetical protein